MCAAARIDIGTIISLSIVMQRGGMTPSGASVGDNYPSLLDDTGEPHVCSGESVVASSI